MKIYFQIPAAMIRRRTHLKAEVSNETGRISTCTMLQRYCELIEFILGLDLNEMRELLLLEVAVAVEHILDLTFSENIPKRIVSPYLNHYLF